MTKIMRLTAVADDLIELRKRAGFSTQKDFADAVGFRTQSGLQRYEDPSEFSRNSSLPLKFVKRIAPLLIGKGVPPISPEEVYALSDLGDMGLAISAGVDPEISRQVHGRQAHADVDLTSLRTDGLVGEADFPIYASAQGGPTGMEISYDPIEYVKRPEPLLGVRDGFGVYLLGDSMEPAYRQGDMILVHPHKPVGRGDDVLVIKVDGANGRHEAMVKTLVAMDDKRVRLKQYNPPKEFDLPRDLIQTIYLIVGAYRRR